MKLNSFVITLMKDNTNFNLIKKANNKCNNNNFMYYNTFVQFSLANGFIQA